MEQIASGDEVTREPFAWGVVRLLRAWRRLVLVMLFIGLAGGLVVGLLIPMKYSSVALFIPQTSESSSSSLELAASQLGVRLPSAGGLWTAPVYVELLSSSGFLTPIVEDTITVRELGTRSRSMLDVLDKRAGTPALRADRAVRRLRKMVRVTEDKRFGGVRIEVSSRWASFSLELADRIVRAVNRYNVMTRRTQASAERQFVERRAALALDSLRASEAKLLDFMIQNRAVLSSPELRVLQDRLQRDVAFRQLIHTSLQQRLEEARVREVRDTPVITMVEAPRLAARHEPRQLVAKSVIGAILGLLIAVWLAVFTDSADKSSGGKRAWTGELVRRFRDRSVSLGQGA